MKGSIAKPLRFSRRLVRCPVGAVWLFLLIPLVGAFFLTFVEFSMVNFVTWSEIVFTFELTGSVAVTSVIIGAVMGLLGGIVPAARAARMSPIEAMRA